MPSGYDFRQLKKYIGDTLKEYSLNQEKPELYSAAAVSLHLGTAAQESHFGKYLWQRNLSVGKGGLGLFQMEWATHESIWDNYFRYKHERREKIIKVCGVLEQYRKEALISNLKYQICMARTYYWIAPQKLPVSTDIYGLGLYWDTWWNRNPNKGTVAEFVENWKIFCEGR